MWNSKNKLCTRYKYYITYNSSHIMGERRNWSYTLLEVQRVQYKVHTSVYTTHITKRSRYTVHQWIKKNPITKQSKCDPPTWSAKEKRWNPPPDSNNHTASYRSRWAKHYNCQKHMWCAHKLNCRRGKRTIAPLSILVWCQKRKTSIHR